MNKEQRSTVVEYVSSLSDDDLRYMTTRLTEKLQGDLPEALNIISKSQNMDDLFLSATTPNELFNLCDQTRDVMQKECRKRF